MNYLIAILILVYQNAHAEEVFSCLSILNYVQNHLSNYGILKSSGRFIYVDVDDEYIHKLIGFLQEEGFEEPPYFGNPDLVGAHITVIYTDELKKYGTINIQEFGKLIHFTPKKCEVVQPLRLKGIDEVYFIVVEAPELDEIRKKYGLPKRGCEFHITIGVKPKIAQSAA